MKMSVAQFAPTDDKSQNIETIRMLAARASAENSRILVAPEASLFHPKQPSTQEVIDAAEPLDGPFVTALAEISAEYGLLIAAGSYRPASGDTGGGKVYNTQVILDRGTLRASYDKLHLYDAFMYRESDYIVPGNDLPPVLDVDGFKIGFSTCYDLRFPEMFRHFADQSVDVLVNGAAWVRGILKEEHWMTLLRARAIENTAYVFGSGDAGPRSVGRSVIYDPLGVQLADAGEMSPTIITAEVTRSRIDEVRKTVPSLQHRRSLFSQAVPAGTPA
jgi:predicted amidohydrolase